jgi:transposase
MSLSLMRATLCYTRLMAKGKAHNAALIACARKLLIYANTVVARGTPWVENAAQF